MGWPLFRIDGETKPEDRRDQMEAFQAGGDSPDVPRLFLLSTRAGGLGVNLTAADTVIFYDQDWVNMVSQHMSSAVTYERSSEPTNGRTSSRPCPSHWPNKTGAHLPTCQCTHNRNNDHAACRREA